MVRNKGKRKNDTSIIRKSIFPCLKPKQDIEILQYMVGRERIIEIINHLGTYYEDYIEESDIPEITNNTEPFEILIWYRDNISDLLDSNGFIHNMHEFLFPEGCNHSDYIVGGVKESGEFLGFGTKWAESLKSNYKNWMLYIFHVLSEFGYAKAWNFVDETGIEDFSAIAGEEEEILSRLGY